jgi:hypothetical protein
MRNYGELCEKNNDELSNIICDLDILVCNMQKQITARDEMIKSQELYLSYYGVSKKIFAEERYKIEDADKEAKSD